MNRLMAHCALVLSESMVTQISLVGYSDSYELVSKDDCILILEPFRGKVCLIPCGGFDARADLPEVLSSFEG